MQELSSTSHHSPVLVIEHVLLVRRLVLTSVEVGLHDVLSHQGLALALQELHHEGAGQVQSDFQVGLESPAEHLLEASQGRRSDADVRALVPQVVVRPGYRGLVVLSPDFEQSSSKHSTVRWRLDIISEGHKV